MEKITSLYRYPVKGLSGEPLSETTLLAGVGIALDRKFAIARRSDVFDHNDPKPLPKTNFIVLMMDEKLARLQLRYDDKSGVVTLHENAVLKLQTTLSEPDGRKKLAEFLKDYASEPDLVPEIVSAKDYKFTDISVVSPEKMGAVSLINLASVRALETAIGEKIDPMRFRANLYFDSDAPWSEFEWMDKSISVGGAQAKITMRTRRCPAVNVNPVTAMRDMQLPEKINEHFGHYHMGVYAEIISTGIIRLGDEINLH